MHNNFRKQGREPRASERSGAVSGSPKAMSLLRAQNGKHGLMQQEVGRHGPWGREPPVCAFTLLITLDGQLSILLSLQAPGMSQKWQRPSDPLDPFGQGKCLEDLHTVAASPGLAEGLQSDCSQPHALARPRGSACVWWLWWLRVPGHSTSVSCLLSGSFLALFLRWEPLETSRMGLWPFLMPLPPQVPLGAPQFSWAPEWLSPHEYDSLAGTALREPVP